MEDVIFWVVYDQALQSLLVFKVNVHAEGCSHLDVRDMGLLAEGLKWENNLMVASSGYFIGSIST